MAGFEKDAVSPEEFREILDMERIVVQFQQILSTRNHSIIGFEGLVRGLSHRRVIQPLYLFDAALRDDLVLELDRLCREKVLAAFREILALNKDPLLFLNLETSYLSEDIVGSGYLLEQVVRHQIPPANIVIEFVESRTNDTDALIRFVEAYRACGLNIALDDVGTGHSNFDRISLLRPDIIKVDRSIINGIGGNYFQQEIFRSLANLSKSIGSLTLAEGVETEEEILCCMEYGADLLQGYYFSRPLFLPELMAGDAEQKLAKLASTDKAKRIDMLRSRRLKNKLFQKTARSIIRKLRGQLPDAFDGTLNEAMADFGSIDALYIIDDEGVQRTNTVLKAGVGRSVNPIFHAACRHENLSHKDYFYQLINTDLKKYTTDRYISFATGNLCTTLSHLFRGRDGCRYILCADFLEDGRGT